MRAVSSATSCSSVASELDEVVGEQAQAGVARLGLDDPPCARGLGLAPERAELAPDLAGEVGDAGEVGLHASVCAVRVPSRLRCLRTPAASSMKPRRSQGLRGIVSSWPLTDDGVHLAADTAVGQQFLDVEGVGWAFR